MVALRTPGDAVSVTWREYAGRVERVAGGLAALGVARGQTVGLMLRNRPEFHWCDTAAMHLGAVPFSIYNTSAPDQVEHVLRNARARVVIAEDEFAERIESVRARCPELEHVLMLDELDALEPEPGFDFQAAWRSVSPDDPVTLIYTSGTTGPAKGVELSHSNLLYEIQALAEVYPVDEPGERLISYLPMAHLAERSFSHYHAIAKATTVTCVDEPTAVLGALQEVRPTWFVGVPRVWEKIKAALELGGDERLAHALAVTGEREWLRREGEPVPAELDGEAYELDSEVLAPVRAALGFDGLRRAVVGGAPMARQLIEFFAALGVPLDEVWGLSESSAVVTVNRAESLRPGTVGTALPGAEVRIAADGEILVRGPMVMRGYHRDPDATAEAIDDDGWLHTGDVGELDADGYLTLVDRKKELIINAAGKNMSPANIEAQIKLAAPAVEHAVAIGDRRPYNVALLVLDAGANADDPELRGNLGDAVRRANEALSRVEQIKRFAVVGEAWEPGGEELTPTMKLRRKQIAARYAETIDALYATPASPGVVEVD